MEKEKSEEIIGYRVGDHLLCPECYQRSVKILSVHDLELPAKHVIKKDIKGFICNQCEIIKGDAKVLYIEKKRELEALQEQVQEMKSGIPYRFKEANCLLDLEDMIVNCSNRISFVGSFFIQKLGPEEPNISVDDASGIHLILRDTEEDLHFILSKISEMRRKGLIIEKKEVD